MSETNNQANKVIKNASWIVICRIAQSVLQLIIGMLTARFLGPSNYGIITYAISVTAFLLPIMNLGFSSIMVQETIQHPEKEGEIYGTATVLNLISSGFCMGVVVLFIAVANPGERTTLLVGALYSVVLVFQALGIIDYWFQAKLLSKYTSIISLVAYAVVSAYKIFLLATQKSIHWFAVSNALDYMIISVVSLHFYRKLGGQKFSFSLAAGKRMFASSKHYILSGMMVTVFAQTDKIMLKLMIDETATGYYAVAVTCACLSSFVFSAIIDSARPSLFESQKTSRESFEKGMSRLYCIIIGLSLAQSVVMTALAKPIIFILYGREYAPAAPMLQLVVWYTTFSYIGSVRNIWILGEKKQKYLPMINLTGALANVVLNAVLIPFWGAMGAAFASLVTQFFTNIIVSEIIRPIHRNNVLIWNSMQPSMVKDVLSQAKALIRK